MKIDLAKHGAMLAIVLGLSGCRCFGEPLYNQLKLMNNTDRPIKVLLNGAFPDSTLRRARPDIVINGHDWDFVGSFYNLKHLQGVTVFLFDEAYYQSKWHEGPGSPDTYLEEGRILWRYHLSTAQLDSLEWSLTYP